MELDLKMRELQYAVKKKHDMDILVKEIHNVDTEIITTLNGTKQPFMKLLELTVDMTQKSTVRIKRG